MFCTPARLPPGCSCDDEALDLFFHQQEFNGTSRQPLQLLFSDIANVWGLELPLLATRGPPLCCQIHQLATAVSPSSGVGSIDHQEYIIPWFVFSLQ